MSDDEPRDWTEGSRWIPLMEDAGLAPAQPGEVTEGRPERLVPDRLLMRRETTFGADPSPEDAYFSPVLGAGGRISNLMDIQLGQLAAYRQSEALGEQLLGRLTNPALGRPWWHQRLLDMVAELGELAGRPVLCWTAGAGSEAAAKRPELEGRMVFSVEGCEGEDLVVDGPENYAQLDEQARQARVWAAERRASLAARTSQAEAGAQLLEEIDRAIDKHRSPVDVHRLLRELARRLIDRAPAPAEPLPFRDYERPLRPMPICPDEIRLVLTQIEAGEVTLAPEEDPREVSHGEITYRASNGWTLVVFSDGFSWDYLDAIINPDGRRATFSDFTSSAPGLAVYRPEDSVSREAYGIPEGEPPTDYLHLALT